MSIIDCISALLLISGICLNVFLAHLLHSSPPTRLGRLLWVSIYHECLPQLPVIKWCWRWPAGFVRAAFYDSADLSECLTRLSVKWRRRHAGFWILYFIAKLIVASWGLIFPCFQPLRSLDCNSSWRTHMEFCATLGSDHDHLGWPSPLISICLHRELQSMLCFCLIRWHLYCLINPLVFDQRQRLLSPLFEVLYLLKDVQISSFYHERWISWFNEMNKLGYRFFVSLLLKPAWIVSGMLFFLCKQPACSCFYPVVIRRAWDCHPGEEGLLLFFLHVMLPAIWYSLMFVFCYPPLEALFQISNWDLPIYQPTWIVYGMLFSLCKQPAWSYFYPVVIRRAWEMPSMGKKGFYYSLCM